MLRCTYPECGCARGKYGECDHAPFAWVRTLSLFLLGAILRGLLRVVHPRDGEVLVVQAQDTSPDRWRTLAAEWRSAGGHAVVLLGPGEAAWVEARRLAAEDRGLPPAVPPLGPTGAL